MRQNLAADVIILSKAFAHFRNKYNESYLTSSTKCNTQYCEASLLVLIISFISFSLSVQILSWKTKFFQLLSKILAKCLIFQQLMLILKKFNNFANKSIQTVSIVVIHLIFQKVISYLR